MMRVIQVGIGGMGNAWLKAVQASPDVSYAGFVEVSATTAQQQVDTYNLNPQIIFPSLDEALMRVQADGVLNVTPPRFHRDVSVTALRAGLPVLSEKPLADTLDAARDIVRVSNETGVLHMVAQNYRYSVPAQTVKQVLASGRLGRVASVTVDFFRGPHFGGFREQMDYPLIVDMSIHHFDLMRFFLEGDAISISGRSWNPPWSWFRGDASTSVSLAFATGIVVAYNGSWCSLGREMSWNGDWRFECEHGVLALRDNEVSIEQGGSEPTVISPIAFPLAGQAYLLDEFHRAVTTGVPPATTCQDNIRSLELVFRTIQAFGA